MRDLGPKPSPAFSKQVEFAASQSFGLGTSGEMTASIIGTPIGCPKTAGVIANVFLSVESSGKDDSHALQVTGEVFINSVTCLTTKPSITHVSGEAAQHKTTKITGDTGIAQAVVDTDANTYEAGDVISADLVLVRTATPTTEIKNPVIVVELEPELP